MKSKAGIIVICSALSVSFGSMADNMSLSLRLALQRSEKEQRSLLKSDSSDRVGVLIRVLAESQEILDKLKKLGFELDFSTSGYLVGSLDISSLRSIANVEGVLKIEEPRNLYLSLDKLRDVTGVTRAHRGIGEDFIPYRGKGITIGMIDSGIEPSHPAFRDERTKKTRVQKYVWTTSASESKDKKFSSDEYTTPEEIASAPVDTYSGGHGTHTSGIAAGSKVGNAYYGVAPDADLLMVTMGENIKEDEVIYGIELAREYAETTGNRIVVNMSLGTPIGPHDGINPLCEAIDRATEAGVVVCSSSGNEANKNMSMVIDPESMPAPYKTAMVNPISGLPASGTYFQCWSEDLRQFDIQFTVVDSETHEEVYASPFFESSKLMEDPDGLIYVMSDNERLDPSQVPELKKYFNGTLLMGYGIDELSQKYMIEFMSSFSDISAKSHYYLGVGVRPSDGNRLMLLTDPSSSGMYSLNVKDYISGNASQSISEYCINDNVISVGAWNASNKWNILTGQEMILDEDYFGKYNSIASYSSYGAHFPDDGRTFPIVTAPGTMVISSLNSHIPVSDQSRSAKTYVSDREYSWGTMTGTSMSSPAVAGIVALWLEACPTLQTSDIVDVIRKTSVRDEYVEEFPESFGNGKINAFEGLKYILLGSGVEAVAPDYSAGLSMRHVGDRNLEVLMPYKVADGECMISDIQGSVLNHIHFGETASFIVPLPDVSGIYLISVRSSKGTMTEKIMVK